VFGTTSASASAARHSTTRPPAVIGTAEAALSAGLSPGVSPGFTPGSSPGVSAGFAVAAVAAAAAGELAQLDLQRTGSVDLSTTHAGAGGVHSTHAGAGGHSTHSAHASAGAVRFDASALRFKDVGVQQQTRSEDRADSGGGAQRLEHVRAWRERQPQSMGHVPLEVASRARRTLATTSSNTF
jgi:hypothetical protein